MGLLLRRPVVQVVENANPQTLQTNITTALNTIKDTILTQNAQGVQVSGLIDQNSIQVSDVSLALDSSDVKTYYVTIRYTMLY